MPRPTPLGPRALPTAAVLVLAGLTLAGLAFAGLGGALGTGATGAAGQVTLLPDAVPMLKVLPLHPGHGGGGGGGGGGSTCPTGTPSPGAGSVAYSPAQVQSAYGYSSATGSGETIAIIDAYGSSSLSSDLACFDKTFSLPAPTLSIVQPFGSPHGSNSGWGLETSLDVEWAHAMAPAASILLIVTPSASLTYLINKAIPYATQHGANVVSMSWGAAESSLGCTTESSEASYFSSAVGAGTLLVAASGDSGANDGTSSPTVDYPSADPSVVGAGGTSLTTTGTYAWSAEVAWNDASGATGGGVSTCFPEPTYQSSHGIQVTTSSGSSTPGGRAVPDVAYDASPYTGYWVYDTSGYSGWVQVGGTSAASPQWAAIFADTLSSPSATTSLSASNVHGLLYSLLGTSNVHDVTSGNNGAYYAGTGYDSCTGVGSPVEASVVSAL